MKTLFANERILLSLYKMAGNSAIIFCLELNLGHGLRLFKTCIKTVASLATSCLGRFQHLAQNLYYHLIKAHPAGKQRKRVRLY